MEFHSIIIQMQANARRIQALVEGVSPEQARWKPDPETWSILEVLCHLYDEEREDFRVRLDLILFHSGADWPPIDPAGWVSARAYNQQSLAEALQGYLTEREKSLAWLSGLREPDFDKSESGDLGTISAGDMLASWAGHDLLHMRQLVELQRAYIVRLSGPYSSDYAGEW
jgi:hypothetical protein